MFNENFDQWLKMSKQFIMPANEINKTTTEMWQRIIGENLEMVGENFSRLSEQFRRLTHIKKPEDLINIQKDCISENMSTAIENLQKVLNVSIENIEQLAKVYQTFHEPIANAMQKTSEKTKKYADKSEENLK